MRIRRLLLPLVQVALAVVLTMPDYLTPPSAEHSLKEKLSLQLGFALNAPALTLRYFLEQFAMQFCPERYMTSDITGCFPLQFIFETVIYFALVLLLWYVVTLELSGRRSVTIPKTRFRAAADALAILYGLTVGAFGALVSHQIGSPVTSFVIGTTYVIWALAIVVFYGRDLGVYLRPAHKVM
jgi:hypothetical protein